MEWRKATGTQTTQPAVLDLTSSPTTVYIRKNIKKATAENKTEVWEYDEAIISRKEYEKNEAIYSEIVLMIANQGLLNFLEEMEISNTINTEYLLTLQEMGGGENE